MWRQIVNHIIAFRSFLKYSEQIREVIYCDMLMEMRFLRYLQNEFSINEGLETR